MVDVPCNKAILLQSFPMKLNLVESGGHTLHTFSQQHHHSLRSPLLMLLVFFSAKVAAAI